VFGVDAYPLYKTLRDVIGRDAPQRLWDENVEDPTDPAEQEPTGMAIVLETEPAEHDEVLNVVILDAPPEHWIKTDPLTCPKTS